MKLHNRTIPGTTALLALIVVACGDPNTTDNRGYTKAPLENPTVLIRGEPQSEMAELGAPNRVIATAIELPEETDAPVVETPTLAAADLPEGVTQEMVEAGRQTFNSGATCYSCHGAEAAGGMLAPALNESEWLHIDGSFDEIVRIIREGVASPVQFPAPMPPLGGSPLTDEQVREVAAYIYAISR